MNRPTITLFLAALVALAAAPARADDVHATTVCKANFASDNVSYSGVGISNHSSTAAVEVFCPLKVVTCAGGNCTYNANAYAVDNNSTNATDSNVTCSLHLGMKASAGLTYSGSAQTVGSAGPMTTLAMSVTMTYAGTGTLFAKCSIAKADTGSSYVNWFDF